MVQREKEEFDRGLQEDLKDLRKTDTSLRGALNYQKKKVEELAFASSPFSKKEMTLLQDIAHSKWANMK